MEIVALVILGIILLPMLVDAPTRRRRRMGIDIWDEMYAKGVLTPDHYYELKRMERERKGR